ncbi:hypothetical protein BYT27DRAFT_7074317, partial [Phlegmacium glaucopus]
MVNGPEPRILKIWQQNTRKSLNVQLATLHSVGNNYDLICIQEPHINFQAFSRASGIWTAVYPTGYKHKLNAEVKPRALTLANTRISTNNWTQVPVNSLDIVAIQIKGEQGILNIYNIYNDCTHSETIKELGRHLERRDDRIHRAERNGRREGDLWLGDFNRHSPWWEDAKNERLFTRRNLDEAQVLIDVLAEYDMELAL